jgi:hypothetical protein
MQREQPCRSAPQPHGADMPDIVFLAAGFLFFGLCLAYAQLCDRL